MWRLYQANFVSRHTHDYQVGFLFAKTGIGKHKKMSRNCLFSSNHNTKLPLSDKNISTQYTVHTHLVKTLNPGMK